MGLSELQTHRGTRYNRLAILSLVFAVLATTSTFFMGVAMIEVFAVGAGHVSLNQIRLRKERGRGLAVTALAIGYAIAVFALISTFPFAAGYAFQQQ